MVPAQPLFDRNALPGYLGEAEIKRRMNELFINVTRNGNTKRKIQESMLTTHRRAEPQQVLFGFQTLAHRTATGQPTNHIWDPVTTCDGHDENRRRFHQSLLVFRIIHRDTWKRYAAIANSRELQGVLDHILTLHVRSFGQMILLAYAVRLRGDHSRIVHILYFIRDMLKSTDFELKIPRLISRYYKLITEGLGPRTNPLPSEEDFYVAAENWLCYCHKAFVSFIEHLSGWACWGTDWLQSKELDNKFRSAIRENLVNVAPYCFQDLRDRVYKQYVLRYIHALETHDTSYRWIRLWKAAEDTERNEFFIVKRTTGKTILFVDDDLWLSPAIKLLRKDVEPIRIDSDNREVVLGTIRSYRPGPETIHVVFWFGRQYICNGNVDYGNVIAKLCHFYTTRFGRVRQSVILPGYNRLHREVWTYQVLCLFLQKDLLTPHAQVVLHPYDAYLWQEDQDVIDSRRPLPAWENPNQGADGSYFKAGAIESRKFKLLRQHNIDLFIWYQGANPGAFPPPEVRPSPFRTTPPANIVNIFGEELLVDAIQRVTQRATTEIAAALDARLSRIEAMLQQRPEEQQPTAMAEDRRRDRTRDWNPSATTSSTPTPLFGH